MTIVPSTAVRFKTQSPVWASICGHGTCVCQREIHRTCRCQRRYKCYDGGQKLQQGMRCWRRSQYNGACRSGRYAGWLYRAPSRWTFCTCLCPWNGKQESDCRDAQTMQCKPVSTFIKARENRGATAIRPASLREWYFFCHGNGREGGCSNDPVRAGIKAREKRRATAIRPASLRVWYNTQWKDGSVTELRRLCYCCDKAGLGPGAPRTETQFA